MNGRDMDTQADGVVIPKGLLYSAELGSSTAPLLIANGSPHTYVFKIRTNQKAALSLHSSHGFLRPHSQLEVAVKIVERPSPAIPLKLEVNYARASPEEIEANDSKRAIVGKEELTKRVIVLREDKKNEEGSGRAVDSSERAISNTSNEEESALDSSAKKEEGENIFHTAEVSLLPVKPIIRTPKSLEVLDVEPEQEEAGMAGFFKHTFSIDRPLEDLPTPLLSEQEVKMNIFSAAFQGGNIEAPSPPPSSRQQSFNPFDVLIQSVKNESEITIQNKYIENKQEASSPSPLSSPSPAKEEEAFNPLAFFIQGPRKQEASPPPKQQQSVRESRPTSPEKESRLLKRPLVSSDVIEDEGEMQALEKELHELAVRIQCQEGFIKDLESLPPPELPRIYPKALFITLSLIFFFLGGAARHFL